MEWVVRAAVGVLSSLNPFKLSIELVQGSGGPVCNSIARKRNEQELPRRRQQSQQQKPFVLEGAVNQLVIGQREVV